MNKSIYVYRFLPIDDSHHWTHPSAIFNENGKDGFRSLNEFNEVFDIGKVTARFLGWEGDIREGPYVSILPSYDSGSESPFLIAWKQDNNGECFIVSPYLLTWMDMPGTTMMRCDLSGVEPEWQLNMTFVKFGK
jgi:hypothetical protein